MTNPDTARVERRAQFCFPSRSPRGRGSVKKRISTENLAFGMYIAELDRPWAETPFAFQGFVLKTQAQLDVLRKYCSAVYIDPERGADSGEQRAPRPGTGASAPVFNLHGTVNYRVAQA